MPSSSPNRLVFAAAWLGLTILGTSCRPATGPDSPDAPAPAPEQDETTRASESPDETASSWRPEGPRPPRTIYRVELERALAGGPAYLLSQLGPEPFRHQGQFAGWRITTVFPDDPELCAPGCDLAVGDVILRVNGDRLETPTAFAAMLERLGELEALEVTRLRDGEAQSITYTIVDAEKAAGVR